MLTVMCPNCRHRFSATSSGCCENGSATRKDNDMDFGYYENQTPFLVPRGFTSGGGCFINAPTIVNGPAIIHQQSGNSSGGAFQICDSTSKIRNDEVSRTSRIGDLSSIRCGGGITQSSTSPECQGTTTCNFTGGTVTITTSSIHSGGYLIQSNDSEDRITPSLGSPYIEIRPKLAAGVGGGSCIVQTNDTMLMDDRSTNPRVLLFPPSGCQELPGTRGRRENCKSNEDCGIAPNVDDGFIRSQNSNCHCRNLSRTQSLIEGYPKNVDNKDASSTATVATTSTSATTTTSSAMGGGVQIQVNATVQLPAAAAISNQVCTVNITATTADSSTDINTPTSTSVGITKSRRHFTGGGIVQPEQEDSNNEERPNSNNAREEGEEGRGGGPPGTPVSWLMPCPWGFDSYLMGRDMTRLKEVKKLLEVSGWYHQGLSWQQGESLLKGAEVGRWLMRDSSDNRFTFAISVQTDRGPTSVRVHYFLGYFRLDAEPRLALTMPLFNCPIKMLEHYVDYSKSMNEDRREVWVDYSGKLYTQIYLTKPLLKEVQSLSHLARLAINKNKLPFSHLPSLVRNYIAEYPYTL